MKTIVVDNNSTDESLKLLGKLKIKLIENHKNLGFAAGVNLGIRYALKKDAEAIVLLNPDTVFQKGLTKLVNNKADITSPVIKYKKNGVIKYDLGGKVNFLIGRSYHLEAEKISHPPQIDYLTGCCMRINPQVIKKIGLFDEKFFLYWEDIDFCLRAQKAGFKIDLEPESIILHRLEKEAAKSWLKIYHLLKGNLIFINRYLPFWRRGIAYLYLAALSIKIILSKVLCSLGLS